MHLLAEEQVDIYKSLQASDHKSMSFQQCIPGTVWSAHRTAPSQSSRLFPGIWECSGNMISLHQSS